MPHLNISINDKEGKEAKPSEQSMLLAEILKLLYTPSHIYLKEKLVDSIHTANFQQIPKSSFF